MTIELFIGIFIGLVITWLLLKLENKKPKPKPQPEPEAKQLLTIDDLVIPKLLPLFKNHYVERGVNITDTHITMTWDHDNCSSKRVYKIHTLTSREDFIKTWQEQEVDFYLRNVSIFGKSKGKKRAKK